MLQNALKRCCTNCQKCFRWTQNDSFSWVYTQGFKAREHNIPIRNFFIIFQGIGKICDMGWAADCGFNEMRKSYCGTPLYLPP